MRKELTVNTIVSCARIGRLILKWNFSNDFTWEKYWVRLTRKSLLNQNPFFDIYIEV